MTKQETKLRELIDIGYKFIKTSYMSLNGTRSYKTHHLISPNGEKVNINFRGTVNSKKSLTSC